MSKTVIKFFMVIMTSFLLSTSVQAASFAKYDGVDGETKAEAQTPANKLKAPKTKQREAATKSQSQNNLKQLPSAADRNNSQQRKLKKTGEKPASLLLPAVQSPREAARRMSPGKSSEGNKGGNAETTWKVEKGEK